MTHPFVTSPVLDPALRWRREALVDLPRGIAPWLRDRASLTKRLQRRGRFRVRPVRQAIEVPTPLEARLLGLRNRQAALVREVLLHLDNEPVVYARSVLPLGSLRGPNKRLGRMANRSLGAELFRHPAAKRDAVWVARVPASALPADAGDEDAWGRQSLFRKRGRPLLVAEVFLPGLWEQV